MQINTKEFSKNSREFLGFNLELFPGFFGNSREFLVFILGLFPGLSGNSRKFCAN